MNIIIIIIIITIIIIIIIIITIIIIIILTNMKTNSISITTQLHVPELQPCPVCVKLRGSDKGQVYPKSTMHCRTVDTQEDSIRHAGPCRILGVAVEACLIKNKC